LASLNRTKARVVVERGQVRGNPSRKGRKLQSELTAPKEQSGGQQGRGSTGSDWFLTGGHYTFREGRKKSQQRVSSKKMHGRFNLEKKPTKDMRRYLRS